MFRRNSPACLIVVADTSRARYFTLEAAPHPGKTFGPNLVEHYDLVNDKRGVHLDAHLGNGKGHNHQSATAGMGHNDASAVNAHRAESENNFAQQIAEKAAILCNASHFTTLVLTADAHLLGVLRKHEKPLQGLEVFEYPHDLARMTATQIHAHLAASEIIQPKRAPHAASSQG